jgi:DNA-binding NarL/FixJ family response regulator
MYLFSAVICKKNQMAISIGIIDDHPDFRLSLVSQISSFSDISVIWHFPSVEEALENFVEPDVILLDINLPGLSGLDAVPMFKLKYPALKIIMLTIHEYDHHVLEAINNGADGYILKKSIPVTILSNI